MLTPSLEDYLEEIYRFSRELGFIRITDVANKLDVSLPSVNKAVKVLSEKGYLDYIPYKNIALTDKGSELGEFLVDRNQMLQKFLETIGSKVDKEVEAEAMEHYLSKETVNAMTMVVNFFDKNPNIQNKLIKFQEEFRKS
ncbi:DNA-binding protein [Iocasia frigidifontis]|uniref:DNA-binding protein n=1 Tax=Iocasia fonsfrigidae TaxID=2682810 RepID=A0A8A7KC05_9FIRM|nr:iron dependent repressor, metal binding and dimerization domain protein [Iocasia fonsfrigidae]QTL97108.1 DNA-binding protein [Iocasia fonsfrigidae]